VYSVAGGNCRAYHVTDELHSARVEDRHSAKHIFILLYSHACTVVMHFYAQQMVTGHSPWSALHFRSLVDLAKSMEKHRLPPVPSCLSDDLQHLLRSCFTWAPCDRPTARELLIHDFCRAVHCEKCVGEPLCDDHGYDGACCDDSGSSWSDSRRSSDCSDGSVDTQSISSESSFNSECSIDQSLPFDWAYLAPASLHSDTLLLAGGRRSAASPSAYWSESVTPLTPATEVVSTSTTAAVSDGPRCKDAGALEEASRRAADSCASSNPFAGRTRVTASANTVTVEQTEFGTPVLEPAVTPVAAMNVTPMPVSCAFAQTQNDVRSGTAAAFIADGGTTTMTAITTKQ
jgi:serine/threonine protein kinase